MRARTVYEDGKPIAVLEYDLWKPTFIGRKLSDVNHRLCQKSKMVRLVNSVAVGITIGVLNFKDAERINKMK